MSLKIYLKSGGKIIVNGAVIQNGGDKSSHLLIHNNAVIMRGEDIITSDLAVTFATRLFYFIQNAYLFSNNRTYYMSLIPQALYECTQNIFGIDDYIDNIKMELKNNNLFNALKINKELIKIESSKNETPIFSVSTS